MLFRYHSDILSILRPLGAK